MRVKVIPFGFSKNERRGTVKDWHALDGRGKKWNVMAGSDRIGQEWSGQSRLGDCDW
jgi:hypothetical protein